MQAAAHVLTNLGTRVMFTEAILCGARLLDLIFFFYNLSEHQMDDHVKQKEHRMDETTYIAVSWKIKLVLHHNIMYPFDNIFWNICFYFIPCESHLVNV